MTVYAVQFNNPLLPRTGWVIGYLSEEAARANTLIVPGMGITAHLFAVHVSDEDVMPQPQGGVLFPAENVISSRQIDSWK